MIKIVFSFDDGRLDNYYHAFKILKKHNLPATIHITTGYIDGTWTPPSSWASSEGPLKIDQILEMEKSNIEFSNHTDKHQYSIDDILTSHSKTISLGIKAFRGVSIPNSQVDVGRLNEDNIIDKFGYKYVRLGRNPKCYTFLSKLSYITYNLFKIPYFYYFFNKHNINDDGAMYLYSIVIKQDDDVKFIKYFLNKLVTSNKDCIIVFMFHSILPKNSSYYCDKWAFDEIKFDSICAVIKKYDVSVIKNYRMDELY